MRVTSGSLDLRVPAAGSLSGQAHRWCASHPDARIRRRWALREDAPVDLVTERLADEARAAVIAALARHPAAEPNLPRLARHRSAAVAAAAIRNPLCTDRDSAAGTVNILNRAPHSFTAVIRHLRRTGLIDARPLTLTAALRGGNFDVLYEALPLVETRQDHAAVVDRIRDNNVLETEYSLLEPWFLVRWPADEQARDALAAVLRRSWPEGAGGYWKMWLQPTAEHILGAYASSPGVVESFARHTRLAAAQRALLHAWYQLRGEDDTRSHRLAAALLGNRYLDPDTRTHLIGDTWELRRTWLAALQRTRMNPDTIRSAWLTAVAAGDTALQRAVIDRADTAEVFAELLRLGVPVERLLANPCAGIEQALEAKLAAALTTFHDPWLLRTWFETQAEAVLPDEPAHVRRRLLDEFLPSFAGTVRELFTVLPTVLAPATSIHE